MNNRKEISRADFEKLLGKLFPDGYCGRLEHWDTDFFLGWLDLGKENRWEVALEVNMDGNKSCIVFWIINNSQEVLKDDEVKAYIRGIMAVLQPDMEPDFDRMKKVFTFEYKRQDDDITD